jgi:hypothetical protein
VKKNNLWAIDIEGSPNSLVWKGAAFVFLLNVVGYTKLTPGAMFDSFHGHCRHRISSRTLRDNLEPNKR